MVSDFTNPKSDFMSESHTKTESGDLICLKPEMNRLTMDMVCSEIPSADNDSIVLAFARAFTGKEFDKGHDMKVSTQSELLFLATLFEATTIACLTNCYLIFP